MRIAASTLWSGEPERDDHLRIRGLSSTSSVIRRSCFRSTEAWSRSARNEYRVTGDLAIKGVTQARDAGRPVPRASAARPSTTRATGFTATARINRHDFGVSWNADLQDTGVVVGDDVFITIDVEAERPDETPPS